MNKWAEGIVERVYTRWKDKYAESCKSGFKVFYSPVRQNPQIMIIGYNPGGLENSFMSYKEKLERGDFSVPIKHEYLIKDYRLAKKMRNFFDKKEQLLEESIKINLIFFRSKNIREWKKIEKSKRIEIEGFCFDLVKEIIMQSKPKMILIEGISTYKKLRKILGFEGSSVVTNGSQRCYVTEWMGIKLFAMPHPTGSRIKQHDWEEIKELFHNNLALLDNQRS
ncbi:Uncharacterised protein [uncultured archaeon]|nr:Uncharacterised protein [uncultured archaeon]